MTHLAQTEVEWTTEAIAFGGVGLLIVLSLSLAKRVWYILEAKIINYRRSNKIWVILGLLLLTIVQSYWTVFHGYNMEIRNDLAIAVYLPILNVFFLQSLMLVFGFVLWETYEEWEESQNFMRLLKIRGFNVNYYLLARVNYLNIACALISLIFVGSEFLLFQGDVEARYFQSFNNFVVTMVGFFMCLASVMYFSLFLVTLIRRYWIVVQIMAVYFLLTISITVEF